MKHENKANMDGETHTDWQTPPILFDRLNAMHDYAVDAAADITNHLVPVWYGLGSAVPDALDPTLDWLSPAFCNPPYGKGLGFWLQKFCTEAQKGCKIVTVLPARIEARWWYRYVACQPTWISFLVGRVPFVHPNHQGPSRPGYPTALVFYGFGAHTVSWVDWKKGGCLGPY